MPFRLNNNTQKQRNSSAGNRSRARANIIRSSVSTKPQNQSAPNRSTFGTIKYIGIGIIIIIVVIWSGFIGDSVVMSDSPNLKAENEAELSTNEYLSGLKNLWWFVSVEELESYILDNSPHVADVNVKRTFFTRKVIVEIEPRTPVFRLRSQNLQYLLSQDGIILEQSESMKELPLIYDEARTDTLSIGSAHIPKRDVTIMNEIINEIKTVNKISFKEFVLADNSREIQAHLKQDYFVKFNSVSSVNEQITDLKITLKTLGNEKPKEYIDVRFSGRVFVK